jgi:hypothetical protein
MTAALGAAILAVSCSALLACSSSSGVDSGPDATADASVSCPIGDPSQPIEMTIVDRKVDGTLEITQDRVPLILPPQGGKVIFVGVRAKNLDGCPIMITASLRDICDQSIIGLDRRPILLEPAGDGWGEPKQPTEIVNYSNLPACPATSASRNVQGEPYTLTVQIEDKNGRTAEKSLMVTPFCAEVQIHNECICECAKGAVLGAMCPPNFDAGTFGCASDAGGAQDGG